MKRIFKIIVLFIVAVITISVATAMFIHHQGSPWIISFQSEGSKPVLTISCRKPLIPEARVTFIDTVFNSSVNETIEIRAKTKDVPFGVITFIDVTVLPGRVTLDVFGHSIDILQRVLIVDGQKYQWKEGLRLDL